VKKDSQIPPTTTTSRC